MSDKHVTIYQKECMLKDIYNMLIEHIFNDFDSISNIDSSRIFIGGISAFLRLSSDKIPIHNYDIDEYHDIPTIDLYTYDNVDSLIYTSDISPTLIETSIPLKNTYNGNSLETIYSFRFDFKNIPKIQKSNLFSLYYKTNFEYLYKLMINIRIHKYESISLISRLNLYLDTLKTYQILYARCALTQFSDGNWNIHPNFLYKMESYVSKKEQYKLTYSIQGLVSYLLTCIYEINSNINFNSLDDINNNIIDFKYWADNIVSIEWIKRFLVDINQKHQKTRVLFEFYEMIKNYDVRLFWSPFHIITFNLAEFQSKNSFKHLEPYTQYKLNTVFVNNYFYDDYTNTNITDKDRFIHIEHILNHFIYNKNLCENSDVDLEYLSCSYSCGRIIDDIYDKFILLPCGHIACAKCILTWMISYLNNYLTLDNDSENFSENISHHNKCPLCRKVFCEMHNEDISKPHRIAIHPYNTVLRDRSLVQYSETDRNNPRSKDFFNFDKMFCSFIKDKLKHEKYSKKWCSVMSKSISRIYSVDIKSNESELDLESTTTRLSNHYKQRFGSRYSSRNRSNDESNESLNRFEERLIETELSNSVSNPVSDNIYYDEDSESKEARL